MNKIFWAGDSTVQNNTLATYPQTGIGQVFPMYVREGVFVLNYAKNGRSTKSFMDEGRLDAIDRELGEGDFLFIQFGHNDEKVQDLARYTEPFSTYVKNLETYIDTARRHGAYPVLITPIERRLFDEKGMLIESAHTDYVDAMKQTAKKNNVPLVDLFSESRAVLERAGEEKSRKWYMFFGEKKDNTHLRYDGALMYAGFIAEGLRGLGGIYAALIESRTEETQE
ncbi:MAG: rhamnogalacturonan acetylesterase [Lachnospiraceae bacterium]|nr:rhamnogalacturonan acetylesterase [Lachnospiraceae bacterium]